MPVEGEHEPSSWDWVREQVAEFEASEGARATTLRDTGLPIVVTEAEIQDGAERHAYSVREVAGDERSAWWERAVAAYPSYADYQQNTTRVSPVLVATRS